MSAIELSFLGGYREQGRSCLVLRTPSGDYIFDAGVKKVQSSGKFGEPPYLDLIKSEKVKAVFVSHLHEDHLVMVPALVRMGYQGPVYMSKPTAELGPSQWYKWAKIFEREGRRFFTEEDCDVARKLIRVVDDGDEVHVDDLSVSFHQSGHALGSMYLCIEYGLRILYTADIDWGSSVLRDPEPPRGEYDIIIANASYGAEVVNREIAEERIAEIISLAVRRGGTVLIPVTPIGRGQEMVVMLLRKASLLSGLKVFLEKSVVQAFEKLARYNEFLKPSFQDLLSTKEYLKEPFEAFSCDEAEEVASRPGVILAPDLMLMECSGRIFRTLANRSKASVIITGYQAPGTLGRLLLEQKSAGVLRYGDEVIRFDCEVHDVPVRMHFDVRDNVSLVLRNLKENGIVVLHHGEEPKSTHLALYLSKYVDLSRVVVPQVPSTLHIR